MTKNELHFYERLLRDLGGPDASNGKKTWERDHQSPSWVADNLIREVFTWIISEKKA